MIISIFQCKNFFFKIIFTSIFCFPLFGCSTTENPVRSSIVRLPTEQWWVAAEYGGANTIRFKNGFDVTAYPIPPQTQLNLARVRKQVSNFSPIPFKIGFSNSKEINAYALLDNEQNYVVFTEGFLDEFGFDPDILAVAMGHELGHHKLGHSQADYGQNRNIAINIASQTLGMLSSFFIPYSGLVVGNFLKGAGLSYSRDDERAADKWGMEIAFTAGFSPCGSHHFAARMEQLSAVADIPFLSTHPGNSERMANSNEFAELQKLPLCTFKND